MDVDAIHHGARNPLLIPCYHTVGAGAGVGGVAVVATGAGVLGGDEHEVGGKGDGAGGAGDGDFAGVAFQGLAEDFDEVLSELREFIEKKDAPMC